MLIFLDTLHLEPRHHKALPTRRKDLELCVSSSNADTTGKKGHVENVGESRGRSTIVNSP